MDSPVATDQSKGERDGFWLLVRFVMTSVLTSLFWVVRCLMSSDGPAPAMLPKFQSLFKDKSSRLSKEIFIARESHSGTKIGKHRI